MSKSNASPKVIPVIHYENDWQAIRNAQIAFEAGCAGVMLINMHCDNDTLLPIAREVKKQFPSMLVGVNYLNNSPVHAVQTNIANNLDMTWTDVVLTHTDNGSMALAQQVEDALSVKPDHLMFTGVAFKHQRPEMHPEQAAQTAIRMGFVPTTSGQATGCAASVEKIASIRAAIGVGAPLAIASGITPENVHEYAPYLSHILVATGVSLNFYEFDFEKLYQLRAICDKF